MKRNIIVIDEEKCTGCGQCIPNCPEGALQIIDGKARMVSELFCDGLGACLGHCPEGALRIVEKEAEEYDEYKVMENIAKGGANIIKAHLEHLREHGQAEYFAQAINFLRQRGIEMAPEESSFPFIDPATSDTSRCPGSITLDFGHRKMELVALEGAIAGRDKSELTHWPVQLQLMNPQAPFFKNSHLLIAADCVPFTYANFHRDFLKGRVVITFCPKLDKTMDQYVEKLAEIFKTQNIQSITIAHMEVPCCFGTQALVKWAMEIAGKDIPIKDYTISIQGEIV